MEELRPQGGEESHVLHELKLISANKTRYKPNCKTRAVDKRATLLPEEYLGRQGLPTGDTTAPLWAWWAEWRGSC